LLFLKSDQYTLSSTSSTCNRSESEREDLVESESEREGERESEGGKGVNIVDV